MAAELTPSRKVLTATAYQWPVKYKIQRIREMIKEFLRQNTQKSSLTPKKGDPKKGV